MSSTSKASALQRRILAKMTGEERLRLAIEMSDAARELALCRLRAEHPELDEASIRRLLIKMLYGVEV